MLFAFVAHAVGWADCLVEGVATVGCLEPIFERIVTLIASFAGIVFFIMLVVGGFRYLFSGGNAKEAEAAKGTLTAAFLGLVLIAASYIFLRLASSFTGIDLTIFKIVGFN